MKNKLGVLLGFVLMLSTSLFSQNYWKTYRVADGLLDSVVVDLSVDGDKVYIATQNGFSIFENGSFTNYDTSNSALVDQNIKIVRHFKDTVYMVTDSGLTQFVNGAITNYTINNGLISNDIEDIEIDSKGELWIATLSGISRKLGNQFTNDPSRVVYDIGINSGDSVYANVANRAIVNVGNLTTAELYVNGVWSRIQDTSSVPSIQGVKFINLSNGRVGIISSNAGAFLIDSTFSLTQIELPDDGIINSLLNSMDIDSEGNYWFSMGGRAGLVLRGCIYKYTNGNFKTYINGLPGVSVAVIKHVSEKLYVGVNGGFCIVDDSIPHFPEIATIETESVAAKFSSNGLLFGESSSRIIQSNNNLVSSFEFPKGSGKFLSYGSDLWLTSHKSEQEIYLSTSTFGQRDFRSGTINNNQTAIAPNMISLTKDEIGFHLKNFNDPNYVMSSTIRDWPADGDVDLGEAVDQAPFVDVNNNGCYDPENGDYPFILGDEAIYMVITDDTPARRGDSSFRFQTEAHIMIYVFDFPSVDYIDQSIFVRYSLVNRSNRTYQNVQMGIRQDYDIGGWGDDAIGCDPNSNVFFAYNEDFNDEDAGAIRGYGQYIPFFGTKFINQTLTGHIAGGFTRPDQTGFRRNLLNMRWRDSTLLSVGGDGYNQPITTVTNFQYPGRLDQPGEWSYINPGVGFPPIAGTDARTLGRVTFDEWKPGERKQVDIVVGVGMDSSNINSYRNYDILLFNLEKAAQFQRGVDSIRMKPSYSSCITGISKNILNKKREEKILVYPNPTRGELNVIANENVEEITIFDLQGKEVLTHQMQETLRIQSVSVPSGIQNGLYLIRARLSNGGFTTSRFILQR